MITERKVFHLLYGQAKPAIAILKEVIVEIKNITGFEARLLSDLAGPSYTLVLEIFHPEDKHMDITKSFWDQSPKLKDLYSKFEPLCDWAEEEFHLVRIETEKPD